MIILILGLESRLQLMIQPSDVFIAPIMIKVPIKDFN